jgi:hypothetical protein
VPTDRGHAAICTLVRRIRRETRRAVPDVDPNGPGTGADVVVVLRDPGFGALTTKFLSLQNADQTTANQLRLFAAAKLPLEICLWWNAVPWDLGGLEPTAADLRRGAGYLQDLIALMERPPVVVACGNTAHDACHRADLAAIEICHPSSRGLYGGGENREPAYVAGLRKAARQAVSARSRA